MTSRSRKRFAVNLVVSASSSLLQRGQLDEIQRVLCGYAPQWSKQARWWRSRTDQGSVDLRQSGAVEALVRADQERLTSSSMFGALGERWEAQGLPRLKPRFLGNVELRGGDDTLTVIIHVDEYVLAPSAGRWLFSNRVALQLRRSKVEGKDSVAWSAEVFEALCAQLSPLHGDIHASDEYDAKNMSREGGALRALGVDASKYLPGLYWLNFLGQPYRDLIGQERLLSAPAREARVVNSGVLLRLADDPRDWYTPAYKQTERNVLDHLGHQYFFSKEEPDRPGEAPRFQLPEAAIYQCQGRQTP